MPLLELEGVGKRYGRGRLERLALRDVSFELAEGELVAIWGRRNSGRSTLLRIAAGLEPADVGTVRLLDQDLRARGRGNPRAHVRYCRKTFRPAEGELVIDRLITTQLTRGVSTPQARTRAHDALARTATADCATLRPSELGTAEVVLVGIARSLVHQPKLLVIDEPTLGVDVLQRDRILALLRSLTDEGTSVLMSVGEATCLSGSDRALSLSDGELHGELQPELAPVVSLHDAAGWTASA